MKEWGSHDRILDEIWIGWRVMKVLVACEFSGTVRDAFAAKGHDAWSCDLVPTDKPGNHIQGDVMDILDRGWDLMIAHPPCTYLSAAGLHYCRDNPGRQKLRDEAMEFVKTLFAADIPRIAIENPVGYLSKAWQKPTQVLRMNQFGHDAYKPTCLWLKGLPPIVPTHTGVKVTTVKYPNGRSMSAWYQGCKAKAKARSVTFPGFAAAMAEQWK